LFDDVFEEDGKRATDKCNEKSFMSHMDCTICNLNFEMFQSTHQMVVLFHFDWSSSHCKYMCGINSCNIICLSFESPRLENAVKSLLADHGKYIIDFFPDFRFFVRYIIT